MAGALQQPRARSSRNTNHVDALPTVTVAQGADAFSGRGTDGELLGAAAVAGRLLQEGALLGGSSGYTSPCRRSTARTSGLPEVLAGSEAHRHRDHLPRLSVAYSGHRRVEIFKGEQVSIPWKLPQPTITQAHLSQYVDADMPPLHYAMCGWADLPGYPQRWK